MGKRQYNFNAQRSWKDMTPEDAEILARSVELPSMLLESDHEDFTSMKMMLVHKTSPHPYPWSKASSHHFYMAGSWEDVPSEARAKQQAAGL